MSNGELVQRFYSAFQKLDYATMQDCYDDEVIFQDPAFGVLNGEEAKLMWEMLAKNAKNFSLVFSPIQVLFSFVCSRHDQTIDAVDDFQLVEINQQPKRKVQQLRVASFHGD